MSGDLFKREFGQPRNPARIPHMTNLLLAVWALEGWTDMRMGQLLIAAANRGGWEGTDIFNCEEEVFARGLMDIIKGAMEE
jgi:hypothetical protein